MSLSRRQILRAFLTLVAAFTSSLAAPAAAEAITLPAGFEDVPLITGTVPTGAVSVDWSPDGRLFVASPAASGIIKIYAPGSMTNPKELRLNGNIYGMAVDRDFESNGYLYVVRTQGVSVQAGGITQRLVRVTVKPDSTLVNPAAPETVLIGKSTASNCPPPGNTIDCIDAKTQHDMGAVRADPRDGSLWVSVGDGDRQFQVFNEQAYYGKMLHLDRNGNGLPGHPFCPSDNDLTHVCTKVAAKGLRNPFRFTLRPGGNPIVGDVGLATREEIDDLVPGGNYGWPCYEGTTRTPNFRDDAQCVALYSKEGTADGALAPLYDYPRVVGKGASVTGGPVYTGESYPSGYKGDLFFADYVNGFIKRLELDASGRFVAVRDFATEAGPVVDLAVHPENGDLVYVLINGAVRRIRATGGANRSPVARASGTPTAGPAPLAVAFRAGDSSDPDGDVLTYDWDFGDGTAHSTAVNPGHTYSAKGNYTARLTVRDSEGATDSATVPISVGNTPPNLSISAPATYRVGDRITARGSATDAEDGPIPASQFQWQVNLIHVDHVHSPEAPSGVAETSFDAPPDHDADSRFEVTLTVTDSGGATATKTITVQPETRRLTIDSSPSGAPISYAGRDFTAPLSKQSAIGYQGLVSAAERFEGGGQTWEFAGWSDGGARLHEITTPDVDSTLVANYRQATSAGDTAFEAETMGPLSSTGDARSVVNVDASGGREVFIVRNATVSKSLSLPNSRRITVRARGDQCDGAPIMVVEVDGASVMSVLVAQKTFGDYSADIAVPAGMHTIAVSFINDHTNKCDRNLRVDKVTVAAAPAPPPPTTATTFEAETMGPLSSTGNARKVVNVDASSGREVLFVRNATVSKSLSLPSSQRITVRARGDQCDGAPIMVVEVDGASVMSVLVAQKTFGDYSADIAVPAGMHTIAVSFINDYAKLCDRNLRVDKVTVAAAPAPSPLTTGFLTFP